MIDKILNIFNISPMYLNKIIGKISNKAFYKNEKMKL